MRVGVDARSIYTASPRGIGKTLIDLYSTIATQQPDWRFFLFHEEDAARDPFAGRSNVERRRLRMRGARWDLWENIRLPAAAWALGLDVLHCPANTAPFLHMTPTVVTIHDVIALDVAPDAPETLAWMKRARRAVKSARHVLTPSEYSRAAIVEHLGAAPEQVTVSYWAPDRHCRKIDDQSVLDAVRAKYGIPTPDYVVAFGAEDPRKNTERVLRAWAGLPPATRMTTTLVIVGLQGKALDRFRAMALAEPSLATSCVLHGFADEADLSALLSGALALCYPSVSEGFGLPILDAFECGVPVITSRTTSLPEVAGEAALFVNPLSVEEITRALAELLTRPARRMALRAAGFQRIPLFSWERCALNVAAVLANARRPRRLR